MARRHSPVALREPQTTLVCSGSVPLPRRPSGRLALSACPCVPLRRRRAPPLSALPALASTSAGVRASSLFLSRQRGPSTRDAEQARPFEANQNTWPGSLGNPTVDQQYNPTPILFTSPTFNGCQNYSSMSFVADMPRI